MSLLKSKRGFTLIELMIVVAIIGILAAIAIPQFASMVSKSQEGATKGNLGSLRSALSIYYGDNEGVYPVLTGLAVLTTSQKYLQQIPSATMPRTVNNTVGHAANAGVVNAIADATGGWYYNNDTASTTYGSITVNCTHNDLKNAPWTSY